MRCSAKESSWVSGEGGADNLDQLPYCIYVEAEH